MTVGERIKKRREELNLSASELAKRLGKDRTTIYRYENGFIEDLPISIIEPLAKILKTTPDYLMGWSDYKEIKSENHKLENKIPDGFPSSTQFNEDLKKIGFSEEQYAQLSEAEKQALLTTIKSIAENYIKNKK